MAGEWVDVCKGLWESWDKDAIVNDREANMFADPAKVQPINFEGEFYKCRGPLNTAPGPQRRPVLCQAGGSGPGIAFAAKNADTVIAIVPNVGAARTYRQAMHEAMRTCGRAPEEVKIFFAVSLAFGETDAEAKEKRNRLDAVSRQSLEDQLFYMSFVSGLDFSKFDLDSPLPPLVTNASKSITAQLNVPDKTLRELATQPHGRGIAFTGTPERIAHEMGEVMQEIGGDGYLIDEIPTRRNFAEISDGLTPALQKLGLIRRAYDYATFRDNLASF
jgi:alkanesulfonate monooxygenase SsuD/methylene tetrahydromethanopterin reductase-like flavin-dependent oxidoreductase (luciferase family)